jgi:hypothetical protein
VARIKPQVESERDKLLREGRIAARREMVERFHSRTPAWRASYEQSPGEGRVAPTPDERQDV